MNPEQVKKIIEAALFAAGEPLTVDNLQKLFLPTDIPRDEIKALLAVIAQEYGEHVLQLKEVGNGYRFQVRRDYSLAVSKLWEEKPPKLSRALLETLAIIAYRQPITRPEIEEVRSVSVSSSIIKTLIDREWIKIVGEKDVPGKPSLYATTKRFLDDLNLQNLSQLPELSEIKALDQIETAAVQQLQLEVSEVQVEEVQVEQVEIASVEES